MIAGFWTNFKTFLGYLSSFIVLRSDFDGVSSAAIRQYLKLNYKVVPSGQLHFMTRIFSNHDNTSLYVPFQPLHSKTVFYRGKQVMVVNNNGSDRLSIFALRFTVDFRKLLIDALAVQTDYENHCVAGRSNFYVHTVVGAEKGYGDGGYGRSRGGSEAIARESVQVAESTSDGAFPIDSHIDESFLYPRSVYSGNTEVDPFEHLYYAPEVERYIEQAKLWMTLRSWYQARSIPWRRGWLLYGPGGTGKSSMAKALAMSLRIPLYQYQLATFSDQEFIREWENMATPSVVLFEDFDTVFNKRIPLTEHKLLTFDTVLNQISGVSTTNGLFLIVTTNHLDYIDEALGVECGMNGISTRPGRIDSVIHLGYLNHANRVKMANQILQDWPDAIDGLVETNGDITPIQFQELCVQEAFKRINVKLRNESAPKLRVVSN
jgi:hypothetical protein